MEQEKRRLQEIGGSLYVSLPSIWINRFNLKKGNFISFLSDNDKKLSLFPEQKENEQKENVTVIQYNKYFFRNLIRDYLFGSDIIRITKQTAFSTAERNKIYSIINNLLNLEIMEEQSNNIIIHNLKSDIMQIRTLLTTQWDKELSLVELLDLRLLIERIEKIGDELKIIAQNMIEQQKYKQADFLFLLNKYKEAYTAYNKKDVSKAEEFWDNEKEDRKRVNYDKQLLSIYDYIKDITDLVI